MKYKLTKRVKIAIVLLMLISYNIVAPSVVYALTSGPAQPETKGFQPAGVSDMVDLQTGDFKYNIPLLDIDGYPINLNYASGTGIDDEASWVGLGWSLNPGAINRQVRGVPDDMAGDTVVTEDNTKPKVTVGGTATIKGEFFGNGLINGSFSLGVFNDNYTGIGAEVGANAGVSFSLANDGALTAGLGVGILSSTATGVDASPYVNLTLKKNADDNATVSAGISANLGYNTRSGFKNLTLGSSFGVSASKRDYDDIQLNDGGTSSVVTHVDGGKGSASYSAAGSVISYNTEPINPKITIPYQTQYSSYSIDAGGALWGAYIGLGVTGYKSVKQILNPQNTNRAYGFLYAEQGKHQKDAMMDFTREKDNPIIPALPNLALPVQTPDLFSYTSQTGSGQFRLYRGGTGAFFDNTATDQSSVSTAGLEVGLGAYFHGGGNVYHQSTSNTTRKWDADNDYLNNDKGDFQDAPTTNPAAEHVYFKQVGEKNEDDPAITNLLHGTGPLAVNYSGKHALASFRDSTPNFRGNLAEGTIKKNTRQLKRTVISYLTAQDAESAALDKLIYTYPLNDSTLAPTAKPVPEDSISRISGARKAKHISEITVTDDDGKRMVYGIPVYNLKQDEYSFAVGVAGTDYDLTNQNQVTQHSGATGPWFTNTANIPGTGKGIDNYYHKESQPAYASSFLLTAILSPDYVDKTGNGISDDDLGTAIKFNYTKMHDVYRWRSPYQNATLNRCLLADADDDKASIVYGEKELWYVHTIESKTKIAYFITGDRNDGLGVLDWTGGMDNTHKQRCLKEIRLYSKADMSRPIKVVKFEYNYQLCPGVPNSIAGGKLTLAKVYFEYGNSSKGKYHPYTFSYNQSVPYYGPDSLINYSNMSTDRWGVYKAPAENQLISFPLQNDEFPYTNQNKTVVDQNASLWQLKQIHLPTGGVITVNYESKDYAYVQDRKAMVMSPMQSLINASGTDVDANSLVDAHGIRVGITTSPPAGADQTAWFKQNYLSGSNYIYTKLYVKISTDLSNSKGQDNDFVSTYSEVDHVNITGNTAKIIFKDRTDRDPIRGDVTANPMIMSAWQTMKDEYPRFAYPGFDHRDDAGDAGKSVVAALGAIVSAFGNLSELSENFYQKAQRKGYASHITLAKSLVRLTKADGFKLGGGSRVKKIRISDNWTSMTGNSKASTGVYGQEYDYTTTEDQKTISSGVASYEPAVGTDENPMKQPVFYIESIKGALSDFFDLEEPFGESFFPAPSVVYGKVTVRDLDQSGNADPVQQTGYLVNEFYTAKDFPVQVHVLPIKSYENKPESTYNLFGSNSIDELCASQGYSIDLNDMPGKPKASRVINQSGSEISSTVYYYNTSPLSAGEMKLNNVVDVVKSDGTIDPQRVLGRDIEFFTDFREQETINDGHTENLGADVIPLFFGLPTPFPHDPFTRNYDYKLFRSACAVKVNQYYGIIDKVVKTENGSSITTQNIAFDGLTGEPLVTSTQNEFEHTIYSVNLPAYWAYQGMGAAYQNLGMVFTGFTTNANAEISTGYTTYLQAGDELINLTTGAHYWVIDNQAFSGTATTKKLIDQNGTVVSNMPSVSVKVIRSGYRNMLGSNTGSIVSLNNPIQNGHLQMIASTDLTGLMAINASATTFDEKWAVNPVCSSTGQTNSVMTNTSRNFNLCAGEVIDGLAYVDLYDASNTDIPLTNYYYGTAGSNWNFFTNGLAVACQGMDTNQLMGINTCITIPTSKVYYIGYCYDYAFTAGLSNGTTTAAFNIAYDPTLSYDNHYVLQPYYLTAGVYTVNVSFHTQVGFDIYDNTSAQIIAYNTSGTGLNKIFSVANLVGNTSLYSYVSTSGPSGISTTYHYTLPDGSPAPACPGSGSAAPLNPYVQGYLGNWRPYQTMVYQQSRHYDNVFNPVKKGMDVPNAGYINNFYTYWNYGTQVSGQPGWVSNASAGRWVTANTVTLYDRYGQQLENKDALGRFSAAKFDFNGELPAAVASNARNREIYASSFEDSKFLPGTVTASCNPGEFVNSAGSTIQTMVNSDVSHSGNYSAQLTEAVTLATITDTVSQKSIPYLGLDVHKQYILQNTAGLYPNGFEPYPGKKYIFDAWIKDSSPTLKSVTSSFALALNGTNIPLTCKAIVEGWKLVEGTLDLTTLPSSGSLSITMNPTGTVYIDDIRIHPFDSQIKTYAYDDKTMRLMAELDENGFATFYEYDDEGLLVRVKKETERGIMTLKESRSSYKRVNP